MENNTPFLKNEIMNVEGILGVMYNERNNETALIRMLKNDGTRRGIVVGRGTNNSPFVSRFLDAIKSLRENCEHFIKMHNNPPHLGPPCMKGHILEVGYENCQYILNQVRSVQAIHEHNTALLKYFTDDFFQNLAEDILERLEIPQQIYNETLHFSMNLFRNNELKDQ